MELWSSSGEDPMWTRWTDPVRPLCEVSGLSTLFVLNVMYACACIVVMYDVCVHWVFRLRLA